MPRFVVLAETFRASRLIILYPASCVQKEINVSSMMSVNAETDMMCCASCGIAEAEVDNTKLKRALASSFDIAALNVSGIIDCTTNVRARSGWLNYVMKFTYPFQ
jgi:hypothetical protein